MEELPAVIEDMHI